MCKISEPKHTFTKQILLLIKILIPLFSVFDQHDADSCPGGRVARGDVGRTQSVSVSPPCRALATRSRGLLFFLCLCLRSCFAFDFVFVFMHNQCCSLQFSLPCCNSVKRFPFRLKQVGLSILLSYRELIKKFPFPSKHCLK